MKRHDPLQLRSLLYAAESVAILAALLAAAGEDALAIKAVDLGETINDVLIEEAGAAADPGVVCARAKLKATMEAFRTRCSS